MTGPQKDGTYQGSWGGTERMLEGLKSRVSSDFLNRWQIICSRVRELDPEKKKILWLHDVWNDPENRYIQANGTDAFEQLVFVSYWQQATYATAFGLAPSKCTVLKNAIVPIEGPIEKSKDQIRLIYHTTPHRGLELLYPAFEHLATIYKNLHLDVYSSFKIYGWPQRDREYQTLLDACANHPNITYHGAVPNDEVREALKSSHIFAYPSIWPETSCIAAIEAMSAGNLVVAPEFGALPETLMGQGLTYHYNENKQIHLNTFTAHLRFAIDNIGKINGQHIKAMADANYNWDARIKQWEGMIKRLEG